MGTIKTTNIETITGSGTLTLGQSGETISIPTNTTLGASGSTITIPSGCTITNNGTQTGFGGANTPAFIAYSTTGQSISNVTETKIIYENEDLDTNSAYDTSNYRFTVPAGEGGAYQITASVGIQTGSYVTELSIYIKVNGSAYRLAGDGENPNYPYALATGMINLSAGDYVEAYVYHIFGSSVTTQTSREANFFCGHKLIT